MCCVRACWCGMLKQVQELQKYLKDKQIPSSGPKKNLVHRVKMHQDSISRQRGGLGEGGMSSNRIVGGESCGAGAGEGGGSKQGGGEEEGLPSSSEDDEDHLVQLFLVHGKRTRTPNTRFFNDNFA